VGLGALILEKASVAFGHKKPQSCRKIPPFSFESAWETRPRDP